MQAQFMAMNRIAEGVGIVDETIFEHRFMHVQEWVRLGAEIHVEGNRATATGVPTLRGAPAMATALRASPSLILAGLVAPGGNVLYTLYPTHRPHEQIGQAQHRAGVGNTLKYRWAA